VTLDLRHLPGVCLARGEARVDRWRDLQQGLYRKVDISHTQVLYHDNVRVGTTRDQVD
jgi:hypothetical protein